MQAYEVVSAKREDRAIPISELSRITGIDYEALRVSLKGDRKLTGEELISLCRELNLNITDFSDRN